MRSSIVAAKTIGKNGNGHRRKALSLSSHNGNASNVSSGLECQADEFRLRLATEISEHRYQEYLKRGDDPQVAAALAETAKLTFGREAKNDIF